MTTLGWIVIAVLSVLLLAAIGVIIYFINGMSKMFDNLF